MEIIEIVIFTGIAIIISIMTISILTDLDYNSLQDKFMNMIDSSKKRSTFQSIDNETFVSEIIKFWDYSAMCELNKTKTLYVKDTISFNKSVLFDHVRSINFCSTLQSIEENCGDKEHVYFITDPLNFPGIVRLKCNISNGIIMLE